MPRFFKQENIQRHAQFAIWLTSKGFKLRRRANYTNLKIELIKNS